MCFDDVIRRYRPELRFLGSKLGPTFQFGVMPMPRCCGVVPRSCRGLAQVIVGVFVSLSSFVFIQVVIESLMGFLFLIDGT